MKVSLDEGCKYQTLVANGFCNDEANTPECDYDGGDCCGNCINIELCLTCTCLNGGAGNGISYSMIGDGYCDDGLNHATCNYDGNDCCGNCINIEFCSDCSCLHGG